MFHQSRKYFLTNDEVLKELLDRKKRKKGKKRNKIVCQLLMDEAKINYKSIKWSTVL
jgi:hypothetical protein